MEEKLGCEARVGYGLTETSPVLTVARPMAHLSGDSLEQQRERRSKTGYAILGVDVRVVDEKDRDVPADGKTVGEIVARSNVVMDGYLQGPGGDGRGHPQRLVPHRRHGCRLMRRDTSSSSTA